MKTKGRFPSVLKGCIESSAEKFPHLTFSILSPSVQSLAQLASSEAKVFGQIQACGQTLLQHRMAVCTKSCLLHALSQSQASRQSRTLPQFGREGGKKHPKDSISPHVSQFLVTINCFLNIFLIYN